MTAYAPMVARADGVPDDVQSVIQSNAHAFYAKRNVTTELVSEQGRFVLKAFVNGICVGGLPGIADALKSQG
jgi:hypothetical protein